MVWDGQNKREKKKPTNNEVFWQRWKGKFTERFDHKMAGTEQRRCQERKFLRAAKNLLSV